MKPEGARGARCYRDGLCFAPSAALRFRHLLQYLFDAEARRLLARREVLERVDELGHQRLSGDDKERPLEGPIVVGIRGYVCPLIWVQTQVEYLGQAAADERRGPDFQRAFDLLLAEH